MNTFTPELFLKLVKDIATCLHAELSDIGDKTNGYSLHTWCGDDTSPDSWHAEYQFGPLTESWADHPKGLPQYRMVIVTVPDKASTHHYPNATFLAFVGYTQGDPASKGELGIQGLLYEASDFEQMVYEIRTYLKDGSHPISIRTEQMPPPAQLQ